MNPQETQQVVARDKKWVPSTERVKISSTNAFTISADVPEFFMHYLWYTIKKVKDSESYEFLLANKKCIVDAKVFRKILDICPRVEGEESTEVQDDDATLTFLIDFGYKGLLHKYTNMENVDYPELIWEDFAFQIDHKKERKSRRETMPIPRFIKVIINHFLSQHKSLFKLQFQHYHTIKDDGIESVDVFEESKPKPAKKKTGSRSTRGVVIQDPPSDPKPKPTASKLKLKGVQSLSFEEEEAADTMQAFKESKKTNRRQPGTGSSSEGTGRIPGVPNESTVVSATSHEGIGIKPGVPDEEK
ncbi:hypothetical protein Tco_1483773, partial [Tanacetum coccineum]